MKDNLTVVTAFSKAGGHTGVTKKYVQDRIECHAEILCDFLIDHDAHVYLYGPAFIARDVTNIIGRCLVTANSWNGTSFVLRWRSRSGRDGGKVMYENEG